MKLACPYCKKDISLQVATLSWHKDGRSAVCPECHQTILLRRYVKPARGRPKHLSKKERLRQRSADAANRMQA